MPLRHLAGFAFALCVLLVSPSAPPLSAQDAQVTINITSTTDDPINFRGAVMFRDGRLQVIEGTTPHTVRGGMGMTIGMFERVSDGPPLLRVEITARNGSATAESSSIVIGSDVVKGLTAFARTLDR
jgi:hypothetical protein